ncbi:DUF2059 domain-containing protein [Marinibactrum halimedae]|uniref:DUF2059 domain-containing protein n=1 Tax=Marinibactrum halimedae TaxID=1444977 RepID=A0AA37T3D2_9GAMM|nr:DUF2059 domain-containing protein [Marinibactrum halimedae]MCD9459149.1 DUF2059 domain-containing protein [Marinibactrum halimedae]GLS24751.1 hypothetical protein GCM10007877_04650 [Marinibactrum halimedae]
MKLHFHTFNVLFFTILLCCSTSVHSASDIHTLMEVAGITEQINELPKTMKAGFEQGLAQKNAPNKDALLKSVDQAILPSIIIEKTHTALKKALSKEDIKTLLTWYQSDLGKGLTAAENSASTIEASQTVANQLQTLLSNEKRVELAKKLDKAVGMTDTAVDIQLFTMESMFTAFSSMEDPSSSIDPSQYRARIEAMKPQMNAQMEPFIHATMVHTYRSFDDKSMDKYAAFLSQPAAQKLTTASIEGMKSGLKIVTQAWIKDIATIAKANQKNRNSP